MEVSITNEMSDEDIDRAIRMHEGDSLPGFPSPDTFEFLALPHLHKIQIPAVECVHNVASALDLLSQRMAQAVFRRFPKLAEVALEMTQNIIQREKDAARIIVEQQVACHIGYLFTNDPVYLIEHGSMEPMYKQAQQKGQPPPPQEEEKKEPGSVEKAAQQVKDKSQAAYQSVSNWVGKQEVSKRREQRYSGPFVQEIRKRLDSYFFITVRNVRDSIPKAIGYYLVRAVLDKLQFELLNALNQKEKMNELLGEPPHILEERRQLSSQLAVLARASNVLSRDPTLAAITFEAEEEEMMAEASQPPQRAAAQAPAARPAQQAQYAPAPSAAGRGVANPQPAPAPAPAARQAAPGPPAPTAGAPPSAGRPAGPAPLFGAPSATSKAGLFDEPDNSGFGAKKQAQKNPLFGDS